jgi:hypothetical protein
LAQSKFIPNQVRPSGGTRLGGIRGTAPAAGRLAAGVADGAALGGASLGGTAALHAASSANRRRDKVRDIAGMVRAVTARTNGSIVPVSG